MTNSSEINPKHLALLYLLGVLLLSPALFAGFMGDDYMQMALLKPGLPVSPPSDASIYGLFSFMDADPVRNKELMGLGLLPWWTYPEMKYAFWRPISELTHGLDSVLWTGNSVLMHLHNIAWYLLLCFIVLKLYQQQYQKLPSKILLAGFALYLLDSSHGFTVAWIANRNGLIAATFGAASVYTFIKSREFSSIPLQISSLALLTLALLSAEIGISSMGYIGAYALFLDKKGWLKGCLATIPHLLIVVAWWLVYKNLGFGAENADAYYLDPIASPITFLSTLMQRLTVLFGSQWGLIPAEIFGFSGTNTFVANTVLIIATIVCLLVIKAFLKQLRNSSRARFWLFGAIFSALPVCSALPHDRLLLFIGIGAIGIFLDFLNHGATKAASEEKNLFTAGHDRYSRLFIYSFMTVHLAISPIILPLMAYSPKVWASQIDKEPGNLDHIEDLSSKKIVMFNVPIGSSMAMSIWRYNSDKPLPNRIWPLTNYLSEITVTRVSKNALEISKKGGFVQKEEESVRNISTQPFSIGDVISLNGLTVRVKAISTSKQPELIETTFENGLDDSSLIFLAWNKIEQRYEEIPIPSLGDSITLNSI